MANSQKFAWIALGLMMPAAMGAHQMVGNPDKAIGDLFDPLEVRGNLNKKPVNKRNLNKQPVNKIKKNKAVFIRDPWDWTKYMPQDKNSKMALIQNIVDGNLKEFTKNIKQQNPGIGDRSVRNLYAAMLDVLLGHKDAKTAMKNRRAADNKTKIGDDIMSEAERKMLDDYKNYIKTQKQALEKQQSRKNKKLTSENRKANYPILEGMNHQTMQKIEEVKDKNGKPVKKKNGDPVYKVVSQVVDFHNENVEAPKVVRLATTDDIKRLGYGSEFQIVDTSFAITPKEQIKNQRKAKKINNQNQKSEKLASYLETRSDRPDAFSFQDMRLEKKMEKQDMQLEKKMEKKMIKKEALLAKELQKQMNNDQKDQIKKDAVLAQKLQDEEIKNAANVVGNVFQAQQAAVAQPGYENAAPQKNGPWTAFGMTENDWETRKRDFGSLSDAQLVIGLKNGGVIPEEQAPAAKQVKKENINLIAQNMTDIMEKSEELKGKSKEKREEMIREKLYEYPLFNGLNFEEYDIRMIIDAVEQNVA